MPGCGWLGPRLFEGFFRGPLGEGQMRSRAQPTRRRMAQPSMLLALWLGLMAAGGFGLARGQQLGGEPSPREKAEAHLARAEQFRKDAVDM